MIRTATTKTSKVYRAFGLTLQSDIELPELRPAPGGGKPDVLIRLGVVDLDDRGLEPISANVLAGPEVFIMDVPGCAIIAVARGREIMVQPHPGESDANIRAYLLGSAIGALLHQRGLLPLHASAVLADGAAVAFLGRSGAGKSTLALQLHDRGYPLVGDDICAVAAGPAGEARVWPGLNRLKLWRASLDAAGLNAKDLEPVHDSMDKFQWPARQMAADGDYRLQAIYLLSEPQDKAGAIEPVQGAAAVKALMDHTFRGQLVAPMGRPARHLHQCLEVLRSTPVFLLRRQWGLGALNADVDRLEQHLARRAETLRSV